ncbi:MAG: PfkB family carbohydrate kinase [Verrucomicrobia bacterium]|nr:PfkB family carbohydrate kinase [Verrucomicrobiota bacterium]MDA1048646.1 PfkB family carbohydrate kinase [Verrucomicrobiota bacterium]
MKNSFTIVGLGEAVFDVFPDKEVLGGTSLNVAVQAHQLQAPLGGRGVLLSRIGSDDLGNRLQEEFTSRNLPREFVQVDPVKPTGQVLVSFIDGAPSYEIVMDTAWDHLQFTGREAELAAVCDAVSFGTMSQRHPVAHRATQAFLAEAKNALKIFDVNLRMDLFSAQILDEGCRVANLVKLNDEEIEIVASMLDLPSGDSRLGAEALLENYDLEAVIFTRGKRGTAAYTAKGWVEGDPASFPLAENADSVGAGDACTAALLTARLLGRPWQAALDMANRHGAFVASQPGATPRLPTEILKSYKLAS